MSYDTEKVRLGREPHVTCTLIMDYCSLTAGIAPCTATETGNAKCYNTRATCNDTANYDKTTKDYDFCQPRSNLPTGVNMFPVLNPKIQKAATSTTGGLGLGKRAVLKIKLKDFPHHDRGIDPYVDERTYDPMTQGTFWGRWLKRNPYFEGRTIKMGYGYIGETFSLSDFEYQEYDITDIDGVTDEEVTITARDVLVRTYDNKAQYPPNNTGYLLADIAASAATATLTPSGIGNAEYAANGTLSIGREAKTFTRVNDVLTFTSHGQWGTTDKAHTAGDAVQECIVWDSVNIIDVLDELLVTGAGLPPSYIPTAEWEAERDAWMPSANVKGILMKPESIEKVIGELSELFMFDIWWDAVAKEVKLKALSPETPADAISSLTEGSNIIEGSLKIERQSKKRYTEVRVFYGKIDYSDDNKTDNFRYGRISSDVARASSDLYDGNSIKTFKSRWFDATGNANILAGRSLARFSDTPEIVTFKLDQKDHGLVSMAERVELNSWQFQGFDGANESRKYQVLEINENDIGHEFTVKAFTSSFAGRYFFIAPEGIPDHGSAADEQKSSYGFISSAAGLMADGSEGYKIV